MRLAVVAIFAILVVENFSRPHPSPVYDGVEKFGVCRNLTTGVETGEWNTRCVNTGLDAWSKGMLRWSPLENPKKFQDRLAKFN